MPKSSVSKGKSTTKKGVPDLSKNSRVVPNLSDIISRIGRIIVLL